MCLKALLAARAIFLATSRDFFFKVVFLKAYLTHIMIDVCIFKLMAPEALARISHSSFTLFL